MAEINRYQRGLDIINEYSLEGNNEISTVPQIREAFKDTCTRFRRILLLNLVLEIFIHVRG